jgi:stage V sporulation protein SpoVS
VEKIGNGSVNLTWKAVAQAEGYYVMPKSMLQYPDVGNITTATNKVTGNTSLF